MITRTTFLLREIYRELRKRLFYTFLRYHKLDLTTPRKVTYYGESALSIGNAFSRKERIANLSIE
jgi:hypothetical protein